MPLENGLSQGYEAIFDLVRPHSKPIAVPKVPDGTPLIRDETWATYVTETTISGLAMGPSPDKDFRSPWRSDVGLVRQQDNQVSCDALIAEGGSASFNIENDSVGTGWLLNELLRRRQPASDRCPASTRDIHPNLDELYRRKVKKLSGLLTDEASRRQSMEIIRGLSVSWEDGQAVVALDGALTALIGLARNAKGPALAGPYGSSVNLVAGAGFGLCRTSVALGEMKNTSADSR